MFAKLLKYELRSNARTFTVLSACALGLAVLGGFLLREIYRRMEITDLVNDSSLGSLWLLLGLVALSLAAYAAAVYIIQLSRFYKNKFTDEGYLTFTLPVNAHQIFLSSALGLMLWILAAGAVVCLGVAVAVLIAGLGENIWQSILDNREWLDLYPDGYWLVQLLCATVELIYSVTVPLVALTVGTAIAKKHKILLSFGIFYGISLGFGFLEGLMTVTDVDVLFQDVESYYRFTMQNDLLSAGAQMIVCLAGYCLATGIMKRKLNLS